MARIMDDINTHVSRAVSSFWQTRLKQARKQKADGVRDQGERSAVTGGAQMDGFLVLITKII